MVLSLILQAGTSCWFSMLALQEAAAQSTKPPTAASEGLLLASDRAFPVAPLLPEVRALVARALGRAEDILPGGGSSLAHATSGLTPSTSGSPWAPPSLTNPLNPFSDSAHPATVTQPQSTVTHSTVTQGPQDGPRFTFSGPIPPVNPSWLSPDTPLLAAPSASSAPAPWAAPPPGVDLVQQQKSKQGEEASIFKDPFSIPRAQSLR